MGVAVPTQFVSTNDLLPTRNALQTMFAAINPKTGALPESGPPLSQTGSDTYHAWTLIGVYNYYLYTGDIEWLQNLWANYTKAVAFLEGKVDSSGLMNVTGLRDWARLGGGGHNSEGNALLYRVSRIFSYLTTLFLMSFTNEGSRYRGGTCELLEQHLVIRILVCQRHRAQIKVQRSFLATKRRVVPR